MFAAKLVGRGAGLGVVALGATVLLGWHSGTAALIQVSPSFVPMQYNTALSFMLCGAALLALLAGRQGWSALLGAAAGSIGLLTLAEYLFGVDLGLDQLFMRPYIAVATSTPGRMAPNTTVCFALIGGALVLGSTPKLGTWRWAAASVMSALVFGLGTVAFTGYLTHIPTAYGWGQFTNMAVHTSAGFMVFAVGLGTTAWAAERQETGRMPDWLPAIVGVAAAAAAISMWQAVQTAEQRLPAHIDGQIAIVTHPLVLAIGLVMALALAYAAWAAQRARRAEASIRESASKYRALFEAADDGIFLTGATGFIDCNEKGASMYGLTREQVIGRSPADLSPERQPDGRLSSEVAAEKIAAALRGETPRFEWQPRRADGVSFDVEVTLSRVEVGGGVCVQAIVRDITARKRAEAHLRLAASVFDHAHEGICITDADNLILDVNEAFTRITGYAREEVLHRNPRLLQSGHHPREFYEEMWQSLSNSGQWQGEVRNRRRDGEIYVERLTISAVRDDRDRLTHYVGVLSDITAAKRHEAQLDRIAHYDALTGIPNRVLLSDRMRQAIAKTDRARKLMAVCYLDLDGFKPVNDVYGHEAGDSLLVEMARRLQSCLRGEDTIARLGGDEFILLLLDIERVEECETALRRILDLVNMPVLVSGREVTLSASVGVSLYPLDDADPDTLMRHADQAMYEAKQAGKNRYHFFDPEHDRQVRLHRETFQRIEEALVNRELMLHYQPKVNMRLGTVVGVEALIRWQHPERGLMPPLDFLPAIENTELNVRIGEWVIDEALRQLEVWIAQGLDLSVSVNVSAHHLQQQNFVMRLQELLAAHPRVTGGHLELEVLETAALNDMAHATRVIEECRAFGVSFALDDFGTGYSSLTYFKRLQADTLKIDQSFVRDMLRDTEDMAIVEGVIGLTEVFRRKVVAEGVESVEHGILLLNLGCELAQGFGIAHPMPGDALVAWVNGWKPDPSWSAAAGFRWPRDDLPLIIAENDHRHWVEMLTEFVEGRRDEMPQLNSHQCRFGRWYRGNGQRRYGRLPEFAAIDGIHEKIHHLGWEIKGLMGEGRHAQAQEILAEVQALRDELLHALHQLIDVAISSY